MTNEDLSRQVDTSDEWITTRTGIRQRYYCTESEDAATLALPPPARPWRVAGWAASEIACCVAGNAFGSNGYPQCCLPCAGGLGAAGEPARF